MFRILCSPPSVSQIKKVTILLGSCMYLRMSIKSPSTTVLSTVFTADFPGLVDELRVMMVLPLTLPVRENKNLLKIDLLCVKSQNVCLTCDCITERSSPIGCCVGVGNVVGNIIICTCFINWEFVPNFKRYTLVITSITAIIFNLTC